MKINELTLDEVKNYLRVEHDLDDVLIQAMMDSAASHIKSYTGLGDGINQHDDLTVPFLMLIGDMYEDRTATVNNSPDYTREALKSFMGMHDYNLVTEESEYVEVEVVEVDDGSGTT